MRAVSTRAVGFGVATGAGSGCWPQDSRHAAARAAASAAPEIFMRPPRLMAAVMLLVHSLVAKPVAPTLAGKAPRAQLSGTANSIGSERRGLHFGASLLTGQRRGQTRGERSCTT